jgi:starch phosphorylase
MEMGLDPLIPAYSGGLGVLAGDSLRAAADLALPMAGVSLLYRSGYFRQRLDADGNQTEEPWTWEPESKLRPLPVRAEISIEGRAVALRAWLYEVTGVSRHTVPVYLLDTDLPENDPWDRGLTSNLYGGDARYRLGQEIVLGVGGVAVLRALGHSAIQTFHMNEGHSGLLSLALLEERLRGRPPSSATADDMEAVRRQCVFTVHTPVPAGHDRFTIELVREMLGTERADFLMSLPITTPDGIFDLTALAIFFCRSANGVSLRHGQVSQVMFPQYAVNAITNGVHAATWASPMFAALFDRYVPYWRRDNRYLRYAISIPLSEIQSAHLSAKQRLLDEVQRRTGLRLDAQAMTLGFARRATGYKRAGLLFTDPERLTKIVRRVGPLQVLYGGKAHPHDESGKQMIRRVFEAAEQLREALKIVYLEEYDMALASLMVSGVDLWLNTPQKPLEASGTSGMKAAVNGVPSLSILDGWWIEGHIEGVTGWSIGEEPDKPSHSEKEAYSLYDKLEYVVAPMFYQRPSAYTEVMRWAIALNGSFFTAQRMMSQYRVNVYWNSDPLQARQFAKQLLG